MPQVRLSEPEPIQVDAAKKVVKKLRMKGYYPEAFENPSLQAQYAMIEGLALQRDDIEMGEGEYSFCISIFNSFTVMGRRIWH